MRDFSQVVRTYVCVSVLTRICVCVYVLTCICTCVYMYLRVSVRACICTCVYLYVCVVGCAHMYPKLSPNYNLDLHSTTILLSFSFFSNSPPSDLTVCSLCASTVDHIASYMFLNQTKVRTLYTYLRLCCTSACISQTH